FLARRKLSQMILIAGLRRVAATPLRVLKALCYGIGVSVLVSGCLVGLAVYLFLSSLPDVQNTNFSDLKRLAQKQIRTSVDHKGKHVWVSAEPMSRDLIYATTMAEDSRYFEHDGVNYDAILRAMAQNWRAKSFSSGASTITQQVTRNLYFTQE